MIRFYNEIVQAATTSSVRMYHKNAGSQREIFNARKEQLSYPLTAGGSAIGWLPQWQPQPACEKGLMQNSSFYSPGEK